ncbi:putative Membrane protein [Pseudomonas amygdali pv. morsprunorum]|nr:putative Membrane protein [Pseudomonas amygdali pv. morsprunorum]
MFLAIGGCAVGRGRKSRRASLPAAKRFSIQHTSRCEVFCMTAFYLKLLITPALMLAISLAARRWGTGVAGLLSGLPMTSALVMLFLSLEQGTVFASMAVPGALAGLAAIQATYLFYFLVTRRVSAVTGCVLALALYGATAFLMNLSGSLALSIVFTLLMVALIVLATSKQTPPDAAPYVALPRWVIPMRMLTATLLLLAITASATWLGPVVSGLLAPIPVIAWPLAVFVHVQGGRYELAAIIRGNAIGAVGVLSFYLTLRYSLLQWGALVSITAAVLLAVVVTAVLARLLAKR